MSTDFNVKPAGAPVLPSGISTPQFATANATELPAYQSVPAPAGAIGNARDDSGGANPNLSRQAFVDFAAGSIVFQVVDDKTSQVLQQYPDQAVLRRRAYFRALDLAGREPTRLLVTDRTV